MDKALEHPSHRLAQRAYARREYDAARTLYLECIANAEARNDPHWLSWYLQALAVVEGECGNRQEFDRLHERAISLFPNAPFLRLCFARDTWTLLKDRESCLARITVLEELLASNRWDRTIDLSPLAYRQKLETLKAWTNGEPGGPLWP
jgi:hypothetical protein